MTQKSKKCKSVVAIRDLTAEFQNGIWRPGSDFCTIEELMQKYHISIVTANKVLQELRAQGLIEVHKGRKSKVISRNETTLLKLDKPVGIINPAGELYAACRWRNAILQDIQQRIISHGNQALLLPADFNIRDHLADSCAGLIYSNEQVAPESWQFLLDEKIPCVRLSFECLQINTVFIDYRFLLDQISMHMVKSNCKHMIYLAPGNPVCRFEDAWLERNFHFLGQLVNHGTVATRCMRFVLPPDSGNGRDKLQAELAGTAGKIAIILGTSDYLPAMMQIMKKLGRRMHYDYELYSMAYVANEMLHGHRVDMKYTAAAEKMVNMFYRQCATGEKQIGEIVQAEFVACN